jgi:NADPH-dependent curcumin reductase CurA
MLSGINRQWLLAQRPGETIGPENFRWAESPIPSPSEGEALVRNLWITFDPTQCFLMAADGEVPAIPIGGVMRTTAASQVIESRIPGFRPGDLVYGFHGWEDYSITNGKGDPPAYPAMRVLPPSVTPNLAVGTLGITGMAAYFGVLEIGRPRSGETFVVSGAAGGVGSIAGQIAKIHGLRVIGIAGGKEKCDWLVGEGGFDGAIDHRSEEVGPRLSALCPEGIDIFFDNVGGPILDAALERLRNRGRVVLCGATSRYMATVPPPGPANYLSLILQNARMEGLMARDYADRFPEAVDALLGWIAAGRLRSKEDVVVGLEHAPTAFARLFSGANLGKQLLKVADAPLPRPA